jgi:rod shape-determining protein MreC
VLLSLVLITVSFRSSALDPVESFAASVMRPFEIAAVRVAEPFRDAASWTRDLVHAKSENERLRKENAVLTRRAAEAEVALAQNDTLRRLLKYRDSPRFPNDYDTVAATVVTNPSTFEQTVTVSAGSRQGVAAGDVVVTAGALVGQVTRVFRDVARVTLITDANSGVGAIDAANPNALGLLEQGSTVGSLVLNRVGKDKEVANGDTIITAGSPGGSELLSPYPRNIPIGTVANVNQSETDIFKRVQVQPFVDFSSLRSVLVLIPKSRPAS